MSAAVLSPRPRISRPRDTALCGYTRSQLRRRVQATVLRNKESIGRIMSALANPESVDAVQSLVTHSETIAEFAVNVLSCSNADAKPGDSEIVAETRAWAQKTFDLSKVLEHSNLCRVGHALSYHDLLERQADEVDTAYNGRLNDQEVEHTAAVRLWTIVLGVCILASPSDGIPPRSVLRLFDFITFNYDKAPIAEYAGLVWVLGPAKNVYAAFDASIGARMYEICKSTMGHDFLEIDDYCELVIDEDA